MQEVFEKIIDQLKAESIIVDDEAGNRAVEIIEQAAAECNNGWIPCSERLPEEGKEVLVWYEYFRYGEYNTMFQTVGIGYQFDGFWSGDVNGTKAKCIAWQPLPEPYQPKGE